jgi:hypothetical protein
VSWVVGNSHKHRVVDVVAPQTGHFVPLSQLGAGFNDSITRSPMTQSCGRHLATPSCWRLRSSAVTGSEKTPQPKCDGCDNPLLLHHPAVRGQNRSTRWKPCARCGAGIAGYREVLPASIGALGSTPAGALEDGSILEERSSVAAEFGGARDRTAEPIELRRTSRARCTRTCRCTGSTASYAPCIASTAVASRAGGEDPPAMPRAAIGAGWSAFPGKRRRVRRELAFIASCPPPARVHVLVAPTPRRHAWQVLYG